MISMNKPLAKQAPKPRKIPARLTDDEAEALEALVNSDGYKVLINDVMPGFINEARERIDSHRVMDQSDMLQLAILKAEQDGMRKLMNECKELVSRTLSSKA